MAINARQQRALNRFSLSRPELKQTTSGDGNGDLLFGEDLKLGDIINALETSAAAGSGDISALETAVDTAESDILALQAAQGQPPAMSETARDALTAVEGQVIYNLTAHKLNVYNGAAWEEVTSAIPA